MLNILNIEYFYQNAVQKKKNDYIRADYAIFNI